MKILGVAKALYPFSAREEDSNLKDNENNDEFEMSIKEKEILFILERGNDGWYKVKRLEINPKSNCNLGIVPENYLKELETIEIAKALYDYEKQTSEEVSLIEEQEIEILLKDDPDWYLIKTKDSQYGFAPSNYLAIEEVKKENSLKKDSGLSPASDDSAAFEQTASSSPLPLKEDSLHSQPVAQITEETATVTTPVNISAPQLPTRKLSKRSKSPSPEPKKPPEKPPRPVDDDLGLYNLPPITKSDHLSEETKTKSEIPEEKLKNNKNNSSVYYDVLEVLSKSKRVPVTIEISPKEIIFRKPSHPPSKWPFSSLLSYSCEKKHVFAEFTDPDYSFEFVPAHIEESQAIIDQLALAAGLNKMKRLKKEVQTTEIGNLSTTMTNTHQKFGLVKYKFKAESTDELSVFANSEVEILDSTTSAEWWRCKSTLR